MLEKLIIVSNESVFEDGNNFYCDNIDLKSIPEGLSKYFEVINIARKSKIQRTHKVNIKENQTSSNIFNFLFKIFKTAKNKDMKKYLIISITPYTFLAYLLLSILKKKIFVYLRSDGYEEYKYIIGFFGRLFYHIMFWTVSKKSNLISCRSHILKGKSGKVVSPSQLSQKWFQSQKKADLNKIKLLYVGRIKVEKGIFSLLKIIQSLNLDFHLTIVGSGKNNNDHGIKQKNVTVINFENVDDSIIEIYDNHNIFILPSFTEGHPQVLDESLSRLRPVIVFDEISHVVRDRKGVFVSNRSSDSLTDKINFIVKNYNEIKKKILTNTFPTKEKFIKEISSIIIDN